MYILSVYILNILPRAYYLLLGICNVLINPEDYTFHEYFVQLPELDKCSVKCKE